jgi:hypothetical protein
MNQPNSNRDFIGGLLLVPALHIAFTVIWFGISALLVMAVPFFNRNYNFFWLFIPIAALSLTQVIYLVPACIYFTRKQRPEVVKGIGLGGMITLLINGPCFASIGMGWSLSLLIVIGMILVFTIGLIAYYYLVTNRR